MNKIDAATHARRVDSDEGRVSSLPERPCPTQQHSRFRERRAKQLLAPCRASRILASTSGVLPNLLPIDTPAAEISLEELHGYPLCVKADFQNGTEPLRLAHWLIPDRLLVGRYPFVHSNYSDRQHAEHQIRSLLESGITTFLCLQAELPPQCEMKPRAYGGFYAYKPVASMLHASAGAPPDTEIKGSIRNKHLDQFLPQKRSVSQPGSSALSSSRNLDFLHFPIIDLSVPEEAGVQELIKDLLRRLEEGEVIYMHCWGGRGRAGTIGACLLKAAYGIDGDEALQRVQRSFDTRKEHLDGTLRKSPETKQQLEFVRSFKYRNQS